MFFAFVQIHIIFQSIDNANNSWSEILRRCNLIRCNHIISSHYTHCFKLKTFFTILPSSSTKKSYSYNFIISNKWLQSRRTIVLLETIMKAILYLQSRDNQDKIDGCLMIHLRYCNKSRHNINLFPNIKNSLEREKSRIIWNTQQNNIK